MKTLLVPFPIPCGLGITLPHMRGGELARRDDFRVLKKPLCGESRPP